MAARLAQLCRTRAQHLNVKERLIRRESATEHDEDEQLTLALERDSRRQ